MRNFRTGPASVRSMLAITIKYRPLSRPERTWDTQRLPSTETPPQPPSHFSISPPSSTYTLSPCSFSRHPLPIHLFPSNPSPSSQSLLIWCISFLLIPSHKPFQLHFYHCWFGAGGELASWTYSYVGFFNAPHTPAQCGRTSSHHACWFIQINYGIEVPFFTWWITGP